MSRVLQQQFNRPVEYDPSLLRQQQAAVAARTVPALTRSYPSREQQLKNELGFDGEEEEKSNTDEPSEQSSSRINRLQPDDDEQAAADEEELERLAEQVQAARDAQLRAEASARRAEERVEELQRMSRQAKSIVVKQFKEQQSSLMAELDEQRQMLAEDDVTISRLRQAVARWEHGDQAGAAEIQAAIRQEKDGREMQRQLIHSRQQLAEKEQQIAAMKDDVARLEQQQAQQPQRQSSSAAATHAPAPAPAASSAAGAALSASLSDAEAGLAAAKLRIASLEREVSAGTQRQQQAVQTQTRSLIERIAELEAAVVSHKQQAETHQRELQQARTAAATTAAASAAATAASSPAAEPPAAAAAAAAAGPSVRESALEAEVAALKLRAEAAEEATRRRDEDVRQVKEKAKEKLSAASESVKKMKAEYASLRAAYSRLKTEQATEQSGARQQQQRQQQRQRQSLLSMQESLQLAKSELADLRVQLQAMTVSLVPTLQPVLSRQLLSVYDGFKAETAALTVAYRKEQQARKALFNSLQELKGNIRVYCRVRPLSQRDGDSEQSSVSVTDAASLTVVNPEKRSSHQFEFEQVFAPSSTQADVFAEVAELVTSVMDGFNVCIFAYGQTGSGKTYTMQGPRDDAGVNVRALDRLFAVAAEREVDTAYDIRISLLEIYCEKIQDLLAPDGSVPLKAVQGPHGMTAQDLTVLPVASRDEVLSLLERGSRSRRVSSTAMNADSSRSHLILSVYVLGRSRFALASGAVKEVMGKLHLIDLAGSERVGRSGVQGEAMKEAQAINSSLSALGNCIAARANKQPHVPYRDSALTFLLQDSLDKNSKTLMLVQVSPNAADAVSTQTQRTAWQRCSHMPAVCLLLTAAAAAAVCVCVSLTVGDNLFVAICGASTKSGAGKSFSKCQERMNTFFRVFIHTDNSMTCHSNSFSTTCMQAPL